MYKYISIGALIISLIIPSVSSAQVVPQGSSAAGYEFLTPLVQTIIQALEDRITDLQAQVTSLQAQLANQPQTQCFGSVAPTTQVIQSPNVSKIADLKSQILTLQNQLTTLQQAAEDEQAAWSAPGRGCGFQGSQGIDCGQGIYDTFMANNTHQQSTLQIQIQALQNQLDSLQ